MRRTRRTPVDLGASSELTAGSIVDLLRTTDVLHGEPSPELISHLRRQVVPRLERECWAVAVNDSFKPKNADVGNARGLIEKLISVLAEIERQNQELAASAERGTDQQSVLTAGVLRDWAAEIKDLRAHLDEALAGGALRVAEFPGPGENARRRWSDIWPGVREDVVKTVRLATGRRHVGARYDGPLIRFLLELIPRVTGEEPSANTVVAWVRKGDGGDRPM